MEKIKMAIVGAGTWGENHAQLYNSHEHAQTVAICDMNKGRAEALAQRNGIKEVYDDYKEMLKKCDCDAVAIVTPDFLHADIAIECANQKRNILIEKPLATTRKDVFDMVEAIERNNVRAMVDLHNRWNPPFANAKDAVESGELGKPYSAYYRMNDSKWVATDMLSWSAKSSILWFLGSHSLDTLRWIFNDEVERVFSVSREGILKDLGVDTVDMYQTTIEFKHGGIAQMENGWITPNANTCVNDIKFNILGTKGMISIDASNHNLIQKFTDDKVETPDVLVKNYIQGKPKGFAFESIYHFIDCLVENREFYVSIKDAANTSLALLAVMESAKTRMPVTVKY